MLLNSVCSPDMPLRARPHTAVASITIVVCHRSSKVHNRPVQWSTPVNFKQSPVKVYGKLEKKKTETHLVEWNGLM